jgi:hypothetical protein
MEASLNLISKCNAMSGHQRENIVNAVAGILNSLQKLKTEDNLYNEVSGVFGLFWKTADCISAQNTLLDSLDGFNDFCIDFSSVFEFYANIFNALKPENKDIVSDNFYKFRDKIIFISNKYSSNVLISIFLIGNQYVSEDRHFNRVFSEKADQVTYKIDNGTKAALDRLESLYNNAHKHFLEKNEKYETSFNTISSDIDLHKENLNKSFDDSILYADTIKNKMEDALSNIQQAASALVVKEFSKLFRDQESKYRKEAENWIIILVVFVAMLVGALLFFYNVDYKSDGEIFAKLPWYFYIVKISSKITLIVILIVGIVWCARMYRFARHQQTLNAHKDVILGTYNVFYNNANNELSKDQVLSEATKVIFGIGETGLIDIKPVSAEPSASDLLKLISSVLGKK